MSLYSEPPPYRFFGEDKPTLLVCWWCTIFACVIIIFRVCGRYVRSEELFMEDKTAFAAIVPILIRMALVHVVILFGTNNTDFGDLTPNAREIYRRSVGSRLVLLSRIFYAASLWMCKFAIIFYLKRITDNIYKNGYSLLVKLTYWFLGLTLAASIISTLAECQPFPSYWRVQPTPPGTCRQGFVQLITTAVGNITSDLILVVLPMPIVWSSKLGRGKQIQISCLFCLSLVPVGITLYRVPAIIHDRGAQAHRSLWASIEILFATSAANALVLGTFMRDRGTKKNKYKFGSGDQSTVERRRSTLRTRDTNLHKRWGSDEDLVRDLGLSVSRGMWEEDLTDETAPALPTHPPAVAKFSNPPYSGPYANGFGTASARSLSRHGKGPGVNKHWRFPARQPGTRSHGDNISEETESIIASASQTGLSSNPRSPVLEATDGDSETTLASAGAKSKLQFFDVGNLLRADDARERSERDRSDGERESHRDLTRSDSTSPLNITISHQQLSTTTSTTTHAHARRKSSRGGNGGFGTTTFISAGNSGYGGAQDEGGYYGSHSQSYTEPATATTQIQAHAHPGIQRSTTSPPFSQPHAPGDISARRKGSAVFLQDVGGLLDGGEPISVSAAETGVVSPLSLGGLNGRDRDRMGDRDDPLGSRNAEAAAREVLGYWDREKPAPPLPVDIVGPVVGGSTKRKEKGKGQGQGQGGGESVEMQDLTEREKERESGRPGVGVLHLQGSGGKKRGEGSSSASKSGFSFVTSGLGRGRGRGRGRNGDREKEGDGEGASPVMPPRLQSGRRDGGEEAAMGFTDVGGLLR